MRLFKRIEDLEGLINAPYEATRRSLYAELRRATMAEKSGRHDRIFVNNLLGHLECSDKSGPLYFIADTGLKVEITEENLIPYLERDGGCIKIRTLVWCT